MYIIYYIHRNHQNFISFSRLVSEALDQFSWFFSKYVAFAASTYGLEMEEISLSNDKEYFKLDNAGSAFLKCNYKITEPGVSVQTITWFYDTSIALTWTPEAHGVGK